MTLMVPLGSVATIDRNSIAPEDILSGTTYVGLENIQGDGSFEAVRDVEPGDLASSKFRFTKKHVLYGKLRPYLRKIARPNFEGICSTDILPILPGNAIDRNYLAHFLRLDSSVDFANSRTTGANLPRISPSALEAMMVPLPTIEEQGRIAAILDQAEALRSKRRQALAKLDTLTQSLFLEMFGDPILNTFNWQIHALGELTSFENGDRSSNYPSGDDLIQRGVVFLNGKNIVADKLDLTSTIHISHDKYKSLSRGKGSSGRSHYYLKRNTWQLLCV